MIDLVTEPDAERAAQRTAALLQAGIEEALAARGRAHVALGGGRTPRRTYELLSEALPDPGRVDWWFGDERCVPPDDPESNYGTTAAVLLRDADPQRVHRIRGEEPPEDAAAAYDRELRAVVPAGDDGVPVLDVAYLGLGEDGHTASLFPGSPALDVTDRLAVAVVAPKPPPVRITMTLPILLAARSIVVLATGAGKADAVSKVLAGPAVDVPASLLAAAPFTLVVDAEAAPR